MSEPATAAQLLQQGLFHHRQGDLAQAMERYVEVLKNDPQNPDALYYVAVVACQEGQFQQGIELARRAIDNGPPQARVHNLLGQALYREGERLEAIKNFDQAIALDPKLADAHGNRANILADAGFADEALQSFDRALAFNPASSADWLNRGSLLQALGRHDEALASFDKAIVCGADVAEAHVNRGNALKDLGHFELAGGGTAAPRFDEATAAYETALKRDAKLPEAHLGRGWLNLLRGNWATGFADYEFRTEAGAPTFKPLPQPRWDGGALTGERLVLVTEQGLGDTIQFCRFAPLLAARGFDVTILTRQEMAPLLSTLAGVTVESDDDKVAREPKVRWAPLLSLPALLGVTPETVPADVPYLAAEPARVEAWRKRLGQGGFKIGINWASGHSDKPHFKRRDIALAAFAPLAALPGVQLISLQKGEAAAQIAQVPFGDKIMTIDADPAADADFFLDTAAIMMNLDLVVTCDTSVTHLAGALGRPVFTALPVVADWRWMIGREDSPWYPTMRLFRQDQSRAWAPVLARIAEAVRLIAN
jgi:tetratricopeptide (TPR) repeat protein